MSFERMCQAETCRVRIACTIIMLCGCAGGSVAKPSPGVAFGEFTRAIDGLERAVTASSGPSDNEDFSIDLRHRVGQLEECVSEMVYQLHDKPEAQAALNVISQTLAEMRKATEGSGNVAKLREHVGKLRTQAEALRAKL